MNPRTLVYAIFLVVGVHGPASASIVPVHGAGGVFTNAWNQNQQEFLNGFPSFFGGLNHDNLVEYDLQTNDGTLTEHTAYAMSSALSASMHGAFDVISNEANSGVNVGTFMQLEFELLESEELTLTATHETSDVFMQYPIVSAWVYECPTDDCNASSPPPELGFSSDGEANREFFGSNVFAPGKYRLRYEANWLVSPVTGQGSFSSSIVLVPEPSIGAIMIGVTGLFLSLRSRRSL